MAGGEGEWQKLRGRESSSHFRYVPLYQLAYLSSTHTVRGGLRDAVTKVTGEVLRGEGWTVKP